MVAILAVIALLLFASVALADISVTSTYSSSSPTFGSDSQRASNPDADDEDEEDEYDTASITVNNSGAAAVTIDSVSVSSSDFSSSDLNVTMVSSDSIGANSTGTVTLSARIPEELDAVDATLEPVAFNVGTVTLTASDGSQTTFTAYMQRENLLTIDKITVTVDDGNEEDEQDVDDDDTVDTVKPGAEVSVLVRAENGYSGNDNNNIKIEDVEVEVESDDSDFDVDESEDFGDIKADEKQEATVKFTVEDDIDEDEYDVDVRVFGDDEHGARHGEKWDIGFEVDRKSHEVVIKRSSLTTSTLKCSRATSIELKVQNIGSSDEDEVAVIATNRDIGLDFKQSNIELEGGEESDYWTKTVSFTVPNTVKAGSYPIRVQTYYSGDEDDGILGDDESVTLKIEDCSTSTSTPNTGSSNTGSTSTGSSDTDSTVDVIDTTTPVTAGNNPFINDTASLTDVDETVEENSFFNSTGYVVLLAVIVLVAIVGGILLVLKFLA